MGFDRELEQSPILKLSLYSLPVKKSLEPPGLLTPPLQTHVTIPFEWEEIPGKPKTDTTGAVEVVINKPKAARCLELPPRLSVTDNSKSTNTPSPTTVFDGPYVARSLSSAFSFRQESKGSSSFRGTLSFGSCRWGDLKENRDIEEGNYDFSPLHDNEFVKKIAKKKDDFGDDGEKNGTKVMNTRVKKYYLWVSIYESLKKVVPWRQMRQRKRELGWC